MSRDFPLTHLRGKCTGLEQKQPFQPSAGLAPSLLWKYTHMFCKAPLAPDSSAEKEGEKCWKSETLGRAQMDASAAWLPETPVPAASPLPLFSFPLGMSALCCCFWSRSLCFPSLLILCFLLLLFSSVFLESCWHNQFSVIAKLLSPSTLQGKRLFSLYCF